MKSLCVQLSCQGEREGKADRKTERERERDRDRDDAFAFFIFIFVLGSILLPPHKSSINMLVACCYRNLS